MFTPVTIMCVANRHDLCDDMHIDHLDLVWRSQDKVIYVNLACYVLFDVNNACKQYRPHLSLYTHNS